MRHLGSSIFVFPVNMFFSEWQKPFNISIGLHITLLLLAMLAPNLFERQPKLPEIYTVNLFTATEVSEPEKPTGKTPAPKTVAKPVAKQIQLQTKKPAISIEPSKPEVAPVVKKTTIAKPISLKPRKQKLKVGKTKQEEAIDKAKLSKVVQRLKASAAQKEAQEAADKAAKNAVSKLAQAMKTTSAATTGTAVKAAAQTTSTTKSAASSGPRGTGIEPDFYMKLYLSAVFQKIHDHWVLPDLQNWDNSLEAVLSITIRRDGTVTHSNFEKKSDNIYFNQFVLKAVKEASPLPPFPGKFKENTLEIGLRFKPGELY